MNSKYVSFFKYLFTAMYYQEFRLVKIARFFGRGLKATSDTFFQEYDPFFKVINWEEIANKHGITINHIPAGPEGMFLTYQNVCIACLVKLMAPKIILEIGTYRGRTTRTLFLNSDEKTHIYTVDISPDYVLEKDTTDRKLVEESKKLTKRCYLPESSRVHQILGDSTKIEWKKIANGQPFDLIFIDGSHSMFHASSDTRNALDVLSDKGMIIWDDTRYRSYMWYKESYRVSEAIRSVLSEQQLEHVYRMLGTDLAVYWPKLSEKFL